MPEEGLGDISGTWMTPFVGSICGSFVVCPTQWSAELLHSLPEGNSLHPLLLGIQLGFFGGERVIFKQS